MKHKFVVKNSIADQLKNMKINHSFIIPTDPDNDTFETKNLASSFLYIARTHDIKISTEKFVGFNAYFKKIKLFYVITKLKNPQHKIPSISINKKFSSKTLYKFKKITMADELLDMKPNEYISFMVTKTMNETYIRNRMAAYHTACKKYNFTISTEKYVAVNLKNKKVKTFYIISKNI